MSFTSVTVTGTIISPQSNPVAGVLVQFTLSQAMTDGMTQIAPQTISTTTATNGTFSVALVANDDPTTTPAGTYYKVLIGEPNNTQNFNVVVPHASAPTVDLFQLIPYSSSAFVLAPSVAKLQAGTGITLSPASGQGIVTVTSTAQGGAGALLAANNLSDVANLDTTRGNLHLGNYIVETPEAHGAVRDGVTDDTAAINAAITAAVSRGQANGTNYAEVQFSAGIYKINGALIQGGATKGNAQIPLPLINTTVAGQQKFTLVFVFPDTGAAVEHWTQTVAQRGGTVLDSNLQANYSGAFGSPSVIGGPTPEQGVEFSAGVTSKGSNMMFKIKGTLNINMSNPVVVGTTSSTPHGNALDLQQVAEVDIEGYRADAGIVWGTAHPPDGGGGAGIRMPQAGNNDNCRITTLSVQGYSNGIVIGEHTLVDRVSLVYCYRGILWQGTTPDSASVVSLSTEACAQHISTDGIGPSNPKCCLTVVDWSIEDESELATVAHVYDGSNVLRGTVVTAWRNKTASGSAPDSGIAPGDYYQPLVFNGGANFVVNDRRQNSQYRVIETPESHGAKRDGTTDDTAPIQAAINTAVARGQADGSNYAEVHFSSGIYQVTSAPGGHGTPTFANSQITLPLIPSGTSTPKFTLKLKGLEDGATSLVHWNQTVGQKSGAVIRTSATGTNDVTWGEASVIGGPTSIQGYGGGSGNAWSNMLVLVDGVRIVSATGNPTMSGFNFEGLLEAKIISAGYFADASPAVMAGFVANTGATFTNQWVYGLKMPMTNNNDLCIVDDWSAEGVWYSIVIAEHTHIRDMRSVYCGWGIMLDNRNATPHWSQIDYASVEVCVNTMGLYAFAATYKVNIGMIDGESAGPIWDGNSAIIGDIRVGANTSPGKFDWTAGGLGSWVGNWSATPTNGHNMRLTSPDTLPGVTANQPAIPASTTAFWNKSLRDASVIITGGTVTAIAVDGTTTGLTSGMVIVPTGKSITLTYTVAPTWNWILL